MSAPATPRPAATVVLLRDGTDGPEAFMVVRHRQIEFAAGALVFPGGSVDPADAAIAPDDADGLGAVRVAAVRELFEESGVLLADGPVPDAAALAALRARHVAQSAPFGALLAELGLRPATGALARFAHWVTPDDLPKRFDTHFFLAAAPDGHAALHDGTEGVEGIWITPAAALAAGEAGARKLLFPTRLNLGLLAPHRSVAAAMAWARAARIVTVQPRLEQTTDGPRLRIPREAGYGGELYPANLRAM